MNKSNNHRMDMEHRILNFLEHLWPYISGLVLAMAAGFKLWWSDRKSLRKVVNDNVIIVAWIREHMATQDDLRACRHDVDEQDADNLDVVLREVQEVSKEVTRVKDEISREIRANSSSNNQQHIDIVVEMNERHSELINKMLELHAK